MQDSERRRFLAAASELDLHPAQAGALLQMEPGAERFGEVATLCLCQIAVVLQEISGRVGG